MSNQTTDRPTRAHVPLPSPLLSSPARPGLRPHLTPAVQAKTLPAILAGEDVLAQAKTGTGKTLGFLVPTLQSLVSLPSLPPANQTSILILSPTRELALQIATAGEPFLRFLPHKYEIQTAIGGTSMDKDLKVRTPPPSRHDQPWVLSC